MSTLAAPSAGLEPRPATPAAAVAILALALLTSVVAIGIGTADVPLGVAILGGLGLAATLSLALWRFDAAVALGFLLLGIVRIEPAPVDGVFAVVIAVAIVTGRLDLGAAPGWILALIGAFVALNLLACVVAEDLGAAASFMGITIYCLALGVFVAAYVRTAQRARRLLVAYVGVAAVSAVVATLALYVDFPGSSALTVFGNTRPAALFKDPNVYGPFVVVAAVLVLMELLEPRLLRLRPSLKLLLLGVLFVGVFFAYSRGAWLNLAVSLAVLMIVLPFRRGGTGRALVLVITSLVAAGAVVATVVLTDSQAFVQERARPQTYDRERFGAQAEGIEIAERNPIGIGPGQFEEAAPISAHSIYVRTLAEEGVLGFVVLMALLLGTLGIALRNLVRGRSTAGIGATALFALWCGMLANSLFIDTLHWRHLWIVAGLIWAGALIAPRVQGPWPGAQASSSAGVRAPT